MLNVNYLLLSAILRLEMMGDYILLQHNTQHLRQNTHSDKLRNRFRENGLSEGSDTGYIGFWDGWKQ